MKTFKIILTLLFISQSFLWAGGSQEPAAPEMETQDTSITIRDSLGRTVVLPDVPQRIVQAGASAFIVNDALFLFPEAKERIVAMADSNQKRGYFLPVADAGYDKKTILPRTVNMEEIMANKPDLVIMKDFQFSKYGKDFEKTGLPVIFLNLESPEAWESDLAILGQVFGNPERAVELQNMFSDYIEEVKKPLSSLAEGDRKKGLILYYSEKDGVGAFKVPPLTFIQTRMLEMAGADPVWKDADMGTRWTKVGFEQIAAWDPDQIFLISYRTPMKDVLKIMEENSYWQELRAYKEKEIHPFPTDFHSWDQPDPRWLLGLQWMAGESHAASFPGLDMNKKAQKFYYDFYSISEADYNNKIVPVLEGIE